MNDFPTASPYLRASIPFTITATRQTPGDRLRAAAYIYESDDDTTPASYYFRETVVPANGTVSWTVAYQTLVDYSIGSGGSGQPYKMQVFVYRGNDINPILDVNGDALCQSFELGEAYDPQPCVGV